MTESPAAGVREEGGEGDDRRESSVETSGDAMTATSSGDGQVLDRATSGSSEADLEENGGQQGPGDPAEVNSLEELIRKLFIALSDAFQKVGNSLSGLI